MPSKKNGKNYNGSPDLKPLWNRYQKNGDQKARDQLIEIFLPTVRNSAKRLASKLPEYITADDLISAGIFGLIKAMKAYDPKRGVKFEAFSYLGIRGSMLSELRTIDWVPRLVRQRDSAYNKAKNQLEDLLGYSPSTSEIEEKLTYTLGKDRAEKTLKDRSIKMVHIRESQGYKKRGIGENTNFKKDPGLSGMKDPTTQDPIDQANKIHLKDYATRDLARDEKLIITLYYYEGLTMKETGQAIGLSECRVSQVHSSVLKRLKTKLKSYEEARELI